jgi:hypothetical protein
MTTESQSALPYASAGTPALTNVPEFPAAARPMSVTVVAMIGVAVGAIGVLCKPVGLLCVLGQFPHPMAEAIRNDSFLRGWTVVGVGTGWLMSLLLLLSSVGCLRLQDWGRGGMLTYAVLAIMVTVFMRTVDFRVVEPALAPTVRQMIADQPQAAKYQLSGAANYAVWMTLGLLLPSIILYVFNRRHVKQAFEGGPAPAQSAI